MADLRPRPRLARAAAVLSGLSDAEAARRLAAARLTFRDVYRGGASAWWMSRADGALACAHGVPYDRPRDAWEALAARGAVPLDWASAGARAFACRYCDGTRRVAIGAASAPCIVCGPHGAPHPTSLADCLALGCDPPGMLAAEEIAAQVARECGWEVPPVASWRVDPPWHVGLGVTFGGMDPMAQWRVGASPGTPGHVARLRELGYGLAAVGAALTPLRLELRAPDAGVLAAEPAP